MFLFKKPKIVLDCFTYDESIIKTVPVDFSSKYYPEWWKKLPKSYSDNKKLAEYPTMKTCIGMLEYYKNSITIPLWSELAINVENNSYQWQFADKKTFIDVHDEKQRAGFLPSNQYGHMKISSPWMLKTKENINWIWSHAIYNFENPDNLFVLPGIINYSEISITHINLAISLKNNRKFLIDYGQPMVHITPMTEKNIEIKRHLITEKEFNNKYFYQTPRTFINSYAKMKASKEKFSQCPFSDNRS